MADQEVKTGILTDFEGTIIRIDDVPYPANVYSMKVCKTVLSKKMKVDYRIEEKDGILTITDIRQHKDQQPAPAKQEEKKECTSSGTPAAAAPATEKKAENFNLNGKCTFMDAPTRTFKMKDIDGTEHPFKWTEPLDVVMMKHGEAKWKVGYYLTVVYNPDTHAVKNVTYWNEGKDKFPKDQKGGGKSYTPRNERVIVLQCCMKVAADVYIASTESGNPLTFEKTMEKITAEAIKAAGELCKAGGVH